ncbi:RNA 2',3'-cyclic phosphodiesterase [Legionella geestiana]|nr:RNA 2',3'-cyclic phosphodiesterase [Legionella geestiana]
MLAEGIRIFLGINTCITPIEALLKRLGLCVPSNLMRLTDAKNLHVTLQFIAAFPSEKLCELIKEVEMLAAKTAVFSLPLQGPAPFPSAREPTHLVLPVASSELSALVSALALMLEALGIAPELRPFQGHITLGKIHDWTRLQPFLDPFKVLMIDTHIMVREIMLYQSTPLEGKSAYTVLKRFALQG